jgi:hypothetical protein
MKKSVLIAVAAAVALGLAGGATAFAAAGGPASQIASETSRVAEGSTAEEPAAPAETTPTHEASPAPSAEESGYVTSVRRFPGLEEIGSEEALVAGYGVCDQLTGGTPPLSLTVAEGMSVENNEQLVIVTSSWLCPENDAAVAQAMHDAHWEESPFSEIP